jgi:YbbR domain-containing protein
VKRTVLRSVLGFFFDRLGWKLLSLLMAVLLWVLVASEPELSTFVSVPVQYKDLPDGLEITSSVVDIVYLELHGPAGELGGVSDRRRYAVVLDMSGAQPGQRTFTIGPSQVKLPGGLRLVQAVPSQLRVNLERRDFQMVPVEVRFGQPQSGYEVAGFKVTPAELQIVGPESHVRRIKSVSTDPLDLSTVVGQEAFHVNAFADDPHVRFVTSPQVDVTVQVRARSGKSARHDAR